MKGLGEMAVIVAVIYVLSCLVGVQGQVGVTICSYRYPYVCPKTVPNSYCNFVTFLCECSKAAGYYPKYDGSRCYYTCGTPAAPENGTVDTSQGTYAGDVATYSCNNGFKVAGDNTTTCVLDAGWNNTATICVKGEIGDDCSLDAFLCENIAFGVCKGTCQCSPGYENDGTSQNCQEIRECASSPCKNGGTCVDGVNNYSCTCVAGYTDKNCTTDIDECENALCQNDGKCVDGINGYTCICAQGYNGINCTDEIHECASSPCKNGGICVDGVNDYSCTCVAGYTDKNCTTDIDECENAICQNDGKCVDEINRYTCICAPGYNGTYCANDKNESGDSSTLPVIILACSLTAVLSIALTLVVLYVVRECMRAKPSTSTPEPAVYYNTATSEYLDDSEVGLHQYERLNEIREREKYYCTLCEISTSR